VARGAAACVRWARGSSWQSPQVVEVQSRLKDADKLSEQLITPTRTFRDEGRNACDTLRRSTTRCNTAQHVARQHNTLQQSTTRCDAVRRRKDFAAKRSALQPSSHCHLVLCSPHVTLVPFSTPQHTAPVRGRDEGCIRQRRRTPTPMRNRSAHACLGPSFDTRAGVSMAWHRLAPARASCLFACSRRLRV
jgi:hypothetical protein